MKVIQNRGKVIQNRGKVIQNRGKVIRIRGSWPLTVGTKKAHSVAQVQKNLGAIAPKKLPAGWCFCMLVRCSSSAATANRTCQKNSFLCEAIFFGYGQSWPLTVGTKNQLTPCHVTRG